MRNDVLWEKVTLLCEEREQSNLHCYRLVLTGLCGCEMKHTLLTLSLGELTICFPPTLHI